MAAQLFSLAGRTALVTGGASGIGQAIAVALAQAGAQVAITVNRQPAALRADEVRHRQILERIPAGRWGRAQDLGGAAVFLASDASAYVHGQALAVDGGWLAR
ncbi:MAG: SDR family oxidoreductase [Pelomonas sp.]|nr:SDR family oxidoreductase [Roseateles sp.]